MNSHKRRRIHWTHSLKPLIEVNDMEPKKVQVKLSPKEKHLQVSIETLTLKPVLSHPQTAQRSRGFCPGGGKRMWTGKTSDNSENETKPTPSYNELEAAQSLVGMKEPQPKLGSIHKLRSYDAKKTTEIKDIVEYKPQQQVKPKLKCQGRIKIKKETETDIKKKMLYRKNLIIKWRRLLKTQKFLRPHYVGGAALITEGKGDVDTRSHIDTLKGIIALLQNPGEKATDICKKDVEESNTDNGTGVPTDKGDSNDKGVLTSEDNVVKYDLKVKIDSDTDKETSKIKSIVTDVTDKMVHKIDDKIKHEDNKPHEPDSSGLPSGPIENTEDKKKPTEIACTDNVSAKVKESVALQCDVKLSDVQINKDEQPVEPCPVHGTEPHDAIDTVTDTGAEDVPVADMGQPPGNVKVEATSVETDSPPVYIKDDANLTAEGTEKKIKTVNFADKVDICEDKGVMINTCAQLDDTISDDTLVIDEGEKQIIRSQLLEGLKSASLLDM